LKPTPIVIAKDPFVCPGGQGFPENNPILGNGIQTINPIEKRCKDHLSPGLQLAISPRDPEIYGTPVSISDHPYHSHSQGFLLGLVWEYGNGPPRNSAKRHIFHVDLRVEFHSS